MRFHLIAFEVNATKMNPCQNQMPNILTKWSLLFLSKHYFHDLLRQFLAFRHTIAQKMHRGDVSPGVCAALLRCQLVELEGPALVGDRRAVRIALRGQLALVGERTQSEGGFGLARRAGLHQQCHRAEEVLLGEGRGEGRRLTVSACVPETEALMAFVDVMTVILRM